MKKKPEIRLGISGLLLFMLFTSAVYGQRITTVAGNGAFGFSGDGAAATGATLADPAGVFVDSLGNVYIADTSNRRIRKINTAGVISTVAGSGVFGFSGDGGPATSASLADPADVFVDGIGNVFIADTNNQRIRKVDTAGVITTVAGDGNAGYSGDGGPATEARLNFPSGLFVDKTGNIFFSDRENHRVRKVDAAGVITTIAGNGSFGSSGDGASATEANLAFPAGVFVDSLGNVFIADRFNYKIRKINSSGVISTVAGNGTLGSSGDGGSALNARLQFPSDVYVNGAGELFIADRDNHRVRKVNSSGVISTVSGNGSGTFAGDGGAANLASLYRPSGISGDIRGALWIADTTNRRIRKIAAPVFVSTFTQGLSGENRISAGSERMVFRIGITGDGTTAMSQVRLTLSDLSSTTGLLASDFAAVKLYESTDAALDGGDTLLASLGQGNIQIGSELILAPPTPHVFPAEVERFYLVSVVVNTTINDGHTFRVGFAPGGVITSAGGLGNAVVASDANRMIMDVVATRLVFTTSPSGSVSGKSLTVQPVVKATDANGNVDIHFVDVVSLSETSSGSLSGHQASAVGGVATFTSVVYTASVDGEGFVLTADDVAGGVEGDLPGVVSGNLTSDVLSTRLVFTTTPAGSVSGKSLTVQPVVSAVDSAGKIDIHFVDVVTLGEMSAGSLSGHQVSAVGGVATFSSVVYTASVDGEGFVLTADDVAGGVEGDLPSVVSGNLVSDILATRLVFTTFPSGSVSGKNLVTQPVVSAVDSAGKIDIHFVDVVTLSEMSAGSLSGYQVSAVAGVATFTSVAYTALVDGEGFVLTADDVAGGVEGDLPSVISGNLTSDVLSTRLVFTTFPSGSVSGKNLTVQPVVKATDANGVVDIHFVDVVTLGETSAGSLSGHQASAVGGVATFTNVVYTALVDGESFVLTADDVAGGVEGDLPGVVSGNLTSDVLATRLVFTTSPAGSVSGKILTVQPVVKATDANGVVDIHFVDVVTLSETSAGNLSGHQASAVGGVTTFTNVTYFATADQQTFSLKADDELAGTEGNLEPVSAPLLTSNVVATEWAFLIEPGGAVSGKTLTTQPLVVARDANGIVDSDFAQTAILSVSGGTGALQNGTAQTHSGVAPFSNVIYTARTSSENVRLVVSGGGLLQATSAFMNIGVIATKLVFATQPTGSQSGKPLFVQPVVIAVDDAGIIDNQFSDAVTLTVSGFGKITGQTIVAQNGRATFTHAAYWATADNEFFAIIANDESGGTEGDLPVITSQTIKSDVVASRLVFATQPAGSVSGKKLTTPPVVVATDSLGITDVDFSEAVVLTSTSSGSLTNHTVFSQSGVATFSNLIYFAKVDGEEFSLTATDAAGGLLLSAVTSQTIKSDVVASRLVFATQPAGSISGKKLTIPPVVVATDSLGITDVDFVEPLRVTTHAAGFLTNNTAVPQSGVATFSNMIYVAPSDRTQLAFIVDDTVGGLDLVEGTSDSFVCDVVASKLVFQLQPAGLISGRPLVTQPIVVAQDSLGGIDVDFSDVITLTSTGLGRVTNHQTKATSGVAAFQQMIYFASKDKEGISFKADDQQQGFEGDLPLSVSQALIAEVVASRLIFITPPSGIISTRPFLTQPVVAAQDSFGIVDVDFSDVITLSTTAPGNLTNSTKQAQNGVAAFSEVTYHAISGLESFVVTADDQATGEEGDLPPVLTSALTAGAGPAHHLSLSFGPEKLIADGVSTKTVTVRVLDQNNNPRLNDSATIVNLHISGAGAGGGSKQILEGETRFVMTSTTLVGTVFLQASSEGLLAASDSFRTVPGKADRLELVYDSGLFLSDGVSVRNVVVKVIDQHNNVLIYDDSTRISLGVSGAGSGGGTLQVTKGEAVFSIRAANTPGVVTLRANAAGVAEVIETLLVGEVKPDLLMASPLLGPQEIHKGARHQVVFSIKNAGTGKTANAFDVALYIVNGNDSLQVATTIVTQSIFPDSTIEVLMAFDVPPFSFSTQTGVYRWFLIIDAGHFVEEFKENNNSALGNPVAFPVLWVSETTLDFGTVVMDSVYTKQILIANRGQAPLSVSISASDSQLIAEPATFSDLLPGGNQLVALRLIPKNLGAFKGFLNVASNDPKGDVRVETKGLVAVFGQLLFDLNGAEGNQNVTSIEAKRDQDVTLSLYIGNLPPYQAIAVSLQFDPTLLQFVSNSWTAGDYFTSTSQIVEEDVRQLGNVWVSVGDVIPPDTTKSRHLGTLRFKTAETLPRGEDIETTIKTEQIRFLRQGGKLDSLHVFANARVRFTQKAKWPDLDGDGVVAFADFLIFIGAFKQDATRPGWLEELPSRPFPQTPYHRFDADGDGAIGFFDFIAFSQDFKAALETQNQPSP